MRSVAKLILLLGTASLASGCAGSNLVPAPAEGCSSLASHLLARETPSAVIGDSGDPALDWQVFGVGQTGQLRMANRDKADGLQTIRKCEERDAKAQRRINAPAWMFWL